MWISILVGWHIGNTEPNGHPAM